LRQYCYPQLVTCSVLEATTNSVPFTTKFHCASILLQKRVCQDGYWQHITTVIQVINMLTPYLWINSLFHFLIWSDLMMTTRNLDICICRLVLNGNIRIARNNHPHLYSWQSTQTLKLFVVNVPTSPHSSHFSIFIMKHKNLLHFINLFLPHFIKKLKLLLPPRFWGTIYKERLTWWS
jgi:hypothetical protein